MKKKLYSSAILLIIFSIFFAFFTIPSSIDQKIKNTLKQLSPLEQEYLDNFFQTLIRVSGFGYILFGDKPMGIELIDHNAPPKSIEGFDYMDNYHIAYKYRFKEGWETWKKYKHVFASPHFIFFEYAHDWNPDYKVICLINKQNFIRTIQENSEDFQSLLGTEISPEDILNDYINQGTSFKIINHHDGLFGTLLGYGRNNAWAFMETAHLEDRALVSFVSSFCKENHEDVYMNLPGFMVLTHTKETAELASKYQKQRADIEKICTKEGFLLPSLKTIMLQKTSTP